ncbi:MAG: PfkB domain protein, partial [Proteobacteria bacterium]|nr:PfkB domain protein [Pseudomonadota bacterium]
MTERLTSGLLSAETAVAPHEKRVLLFGELLADCFFDEEKIGGAPFNVARHLCAFGAQPLLVSRIGKDALGGRLQALMAQWHMETAGIQKDEAHATGRVQVHTGGNGHRFEILPDQAYDHIAAETALEVARTTAPAVLYFGTLIQRQAP